VRLEGLGKMKNPMTSSGIKPATFRFVVQCLNQLCYRMTYIWSQELYIWKGKGSITSSAIDWKFILSVEHGNGGGHKAREM
jgi:hypothetical protein